MSEDNHASFAKIGFTVLIGIVAIVATLIYLGGIRGHGRETILETYYDKPVSGLSVGSAVNFRGVKIGEVREISFVSVKYPETDSTKTGYLIYIEMAIFDEALYVGSEEYDDNLMLAYLHDQVAAGLRATISSSGITGLSHIELDYVKTDAPPLTIGLTPRHYYVPASTSLLDNFSDAATKVMNQINRMDLEAAWSNIANAVESLSRVSEGARVMMESRQDELETILEDLSQTSASVKELTAELKKNPSLLIRERIPEPLEETE